MSITIIGRVFENEDLYRGELLRTVKFLENMIDRNIGERGPDIFNKLMIKRCDEIYSLIGELGGKLHDCDDVVFVRLRKDCGFGETGNFGFCSISHNSMGSMQPCCEALCPKGKKID